MNQNYKLNFFLSVIVAKLENSVLFNPALVNVESELPSFFYNILYKHHNMPLPNINFQQNKSKHNYRERLDFRVRLSQARERLSCVVLLKY
jgi:hypothetical protein